MRHIYHYSAEYQVQPGQIHSIDGIALMGKKVADMTDYHGLKMSVAALSSHGVSADKLSITSLSYLGVEE